MIWETEGAAKRHPESAMSDPLPEMSPPRAAAEDVPDLSQQGAPLNRGPWDIGTLGHPDNWSSWRFTTPYKQRIEHIFDGQTFIAVHEVSKQGVEHWHVLVNNVDNYDAIRKRVQRKLEYKDMKWWSKKNSGTFEKALAYTKKTVDNNGNEKYVQSDDWPNYQYTKWVFTVQSIIRTDAKEDKERASTLILKEVMDWEKYYYDEFNEECLKGDLERDDR